MRGVSLPSLQDAQEPGGWRQRRNSTHVTALLGLVYALGIARNERMLHHVRHDATIPAEPHAAARLWLNVPRRILDSALW
ncbi:hypothetical protein [Micromonospora echinaurantiaca]|uniref:hypothetical protein n=1 Tax=Micromonospora echinaurantiaca TaxID=47857 RepID=UPI003436D81D